MKLLPEKIAESLLTLSENNIPVAFIQDYPSSVLMGDSTVADCGKLLERLREECDHVELTDLASYCEPWQDLKVAQPHKNLASYHYKQPDGDIYVFFNEDPNEAIKTQVGLKDHGILVNYDAFSNKLNSIDCHQVDGKLIFDVNLEPYQSQIIVLQEDWSGYDIMKALPEKITEQTDVSEDWQLYFSDAAHYFKDLSNATFTEIGCYDKLMPISKESAYRDKTGTIRYIKKVDWRSKERNAKIFIDLGDVYETVEVYINKKSAGVKFCPPYRMEVPELLREGENELIVEVTNTLGNENKDFMSQYTPIEPFGMLGPVKIVEKNE